MSDLVTISDIARRKRKSYNWIRELMKEKGAPDPARAFGNVKVWDWKKVERYLEERISNV